MIFRPLRTIGLLSGGVVELALLGIAGYLTHSIFDTPVSLVSLLLGAGVVFLLLAAAIVFFWLYACFSLKYVVKSNAVVVSSGAVQHFIPLGQIENVVPGSEISGWVWQKGLRWPGFSSGFAKVEQLGYTLFHSSHRSVSDLVFLVTPTLSYAISPQDAEEFSKVVIQMKKDCADAAETQITRHWPVITLSFWRDRKAQLAVLLAIVLNVALFGYVLNYYPGLPELLPMHFTATGEVDRIGFKTEVLRIPFIALFVLCMNAVFAVLLHIRERLASYLIISAGLFVQALFLVAVFKILQV